jgi:recombination protein RecA
MSPPFRLTQFEVLFGKGIDKLGEIMQLASDFEIARKHGKVMTYKETKYDLEEFKKMLIEDPKFFDKLRTDIISKIQETPIELEDENQD